MGFLFSDVYTKAIALFDDPRISKAYETDRVQFSKIMYTYMQNAIGMFNNPLSVSLRLSEYNEPKGTMQIFQGDGKNNEFLLDEEFEILLNSEYCYMERDIMVQGSIDKNKHTVIFPDVLPEGKEYAVEQYYVGEFTDDFSNLTLNDVGNKQIVEYVKNILARLLVKAWGEEERNMLLDLRNLMQDSDFKIMSNDRILKSKNEWVNQLDTEICNQTSKLSWQIRFANGSRKIGRG